MLAANGIALQFTDQAVTYLAEKGYDPQFGARPVKRVIQDLVLNRLSKEILGGKIHRERPVVVGFDGSELHFKNLTHLCRGNRGSRGRVLKFIP